MARVCATEGSMTATNSSLTPARWLYFKYHGLLRRVRRLTRHLKRDPLVATYDLMRSDNGAAPSVYQAGRFWADINRAFEDLIYRDALPRLRDGYFNRAFAAPEPGSRQVYRALLWLYYCHLRGRDEGVLLDRVSETSVGGTYDQEEIDGRRVSLDLLQSVDEVSAIREAWRRSGRKGNPRVIVDLGAGYGRLGHVSLRAFPESTYVVLDLPEALMCSSYWLDRAFPGDVVPYRESRSLQALPRELLERRRIWTLGAHQIECLGADSIDVFVNIYSFAEMRPEAISRYFDQIDRTTRGVLFLKQRRTENNQVDRVSVTEATYPIRPGWHEIYRRSNSLYPDFFEAAFDTSPC